MTRTFPVLTAEKLHARVGEEVVLYKSAFDYNTHFSQARGRLHEDDGVYSVQSSGKNYPIERHRVIQPNMIGFQVLEFPSLPDKRRPGKYKAYAVELL